ncbi:SAM-dependent methyltransferase [Crossiella sp. NPDC003009]
MTGAQRDWAGPRSARVYDYLLGGGHNFAVDREFADRMVAEMPWVAHSAVVNRAFVRRVVHFMLSAGVRQFLDLGCGIPGVDPVHLVARQAAPETRVVYVDHDELAVAHAELLLDGDEQATVLRADAADPRAVLTAPEVRRMLDFTAPIGLLAIALLHYVPNERDPEGMLTGYANRLAEGSFLALSHATFDVSPEPVKQAQGWMVDSDPVHPRGRDRIEGFFTGFDLVAPGLVHPGQWRNPVRPGPNAVGEWSFAGVGRKTSSTEGTA